MRPMTRTIVVLAVALAAASCDKGESSSPASGGTNAVLDAWKKIGLTVGAFDKADAAKYGGGDCRAGTVSGVETVLCTFKTPEEAEAARAKGLEAVGGATGAAIATGSMLLVVADRAKADPSGRTINQMTKVFRGR